MSRRKEKAEPYEGEASEDQSTSEGSHEALPSDSDIVPTSQQEQHTDKPGEAQGASSKPGKSGVLLAFFALIVAIGGIAAGYQLWQKNLAVVGQLDDQAGQIVGKVDNSLKDADQRILNVEGKVSQLAQATSSLEPKIASIQATSQGELKALDSRLNDKITTDFNILKDSITALQANLSEANPEERLWEPAEVEYLIRIAIDSLQLRRDVSTAIAALSAADRRLRDLGHPAFAETRRHIADDLTALLAIPKADIAGAAFTLSSLQEAVEQLPLPASASAPEQSSTTVTDETAGEVEKETGWKGFFTGMWQAFTDLVTVRRRDQADQPVMAPEQQLYLTQNLQLKLETARLALLRRDERTFHDSLKTAREWVLKYYDAEAAMVASTLTSLQQLDQMVVNPELPSLSTSLNALRGAIASQAYLPKGRSDRQQVAILQSNHSGGE